VLAALQAGQLQAGGHVFDHFASADQLWAQMPYPSRMAAPGARAGQKQSGKSGLHGGHGVEVIS
jgi:hypothetical protein